MSDQSTSSIDEYINTTLSQIRKGIPEGAVIDGSIRFEMATVGQKDKGGKLDISIINVGAAVSESQTQKVSFAVKYLTETEIAKDAAEKAKAELTKKMSEQMSGIRR